MDNYNLQKLRRKNIHEERKRIGIRLNEYFAKNYSPDTDKDTLRNELSAVVNNLDEEE